MHARFRLWLILATLIMPGSAIAANEITSVTQIFSQCRAGSGASQIRYHRCLIGEYERLIKRSDRQTDQLLGLVGRHRAFGRMRIIQWSNAISKSQSRWQRLIAWDCEWPGHFSLELKKAAAVMTECRIDRAVKRVQLLEKRIKAINTLTKHDEKKDR